MYKKYYKLQNIAEQKKKVEKIGPQSKMLIHTKIVRSLDSVRRAAEWWLPNLWLGFFSSQYFLDC